MKGLFTRLVALAAPILISSLAFGAPAGAVKVPADAPVDSGEGDRHRGVEWKAAGAFLSLGSMTVVYPAGPGESVEINKRSAEARARWLAAVYKNKVTVVADDQVSDEQKKGNLLLLGWNNRVFGPSGPARPFTHDDAGTRFLGILEPDPKVDLLVFHRNPLDWSSFILFWSRIDPERDRYQVLPRIGSDWAMFRDYRPARQGMFVPARVWPPGRDKLAEADHTSEAFARPGGTASFDSAHYHVVFDRTAFQDADVNAIVQAREAAFDKAVAAIGPAPKDFRILLYVYDDEDVKEEATGVKDPVHEVPSAREMHATRRFALSTSPRQELKLLARAMYGPCYLTSFCEGLSLSYINSFRGQDLDTHAAMMRSSDQLPPLADLLDEERFRALPGEQATVSAGVLMTWLRKSFDGVGLKKAYGIADGTTAALAAALGLDEAALTASFASWADARVAAHKNEVDFLAAEAEAQERQLTSDWKGMAAALQKALKAKPGDPQTLFNLASAQMRADDLKGAEASLKTMLEGKLGPQDARFRIFGHYQLGRVYDLAGRRAEALAEYDAVVALPDDHGAHALAQERKSSPATREQLE